MKLYLAGPMTGYPDLNFDAFQEGARVLRSLGYEVFSPAEHDIFLCGGDEAMARSPDVPIPRRQVLADDLAWICKEAEGIAMLREWGGSKGAQAEYATARALGLPVLFQQHTGEFA